MDRKRIVELMHEETTEPYRFDDGWLTRFMVRLNQEDPELAKAIVRAADKKLKEMNNDKTIRTNTGD